MKVKNLRQYLNLLPSEFDNREIRFVNGGNVFVMDKYVEPVDENNVEFLDLKVR